MRRERGGDPLNRFLATWKNLHSGPETTPTNLPQEEKKISKKSSTERETRKGGEAERNGEERAREESVTEGSGDSNREEDIVEDFNFSSDSDHSE